MSESLAGPAVVRGAGIAERVAGERAAPADARRALQLALAVIWLLDGVLQFQPFMFGKGFPQMLAGTAQGNPGFAARSITWNAAFVSHHLAVFNAIFACVQAAIGLGIAWRPAVRIALAGSVAWAVGVWWLGEGFGGVVSGSASPLNGAPGAVILYALLAVLLWPPAKDRPAPFVAGRAVGAGVARALWLVLWASLGYFALTPASRAPGAASTMISGMASTEPGWLAGLDNTVATALAGRGLLVSVLLAVAFGIVAVGIYLPLRLTRAVIAAALVLAAFIWLAEGFGGILGGSATDPNSGPLLALLALAYWPNTEGA